MKRIVIILLLSGYIAALYGQEDATLGNAINKITNQLIVFPQEKVYLQTDKPYYITGEKIFFRAFLLDAFSNKQAMLSRYVYVELINPVDSVVNRLKIRRDSTYMFYGAISLPEDLPQGVYKIRAYTQYMQNQGESSFFSKQVKISDPQILSVQTESNFQYGGDGKINASLRFINTVTKDVIQPKSVSMQVNQDQTFTRKPDKDGWIRAQLNLPDSASKRILYVELANGRNVFKQYIPIPYPESDFDVSFYPEGGHLIAGQSSNVAFKAMNTHGASLNIKGKVVDSKGNTVTEFKTVHDGMGDFFITPLPDEQYRAMVQVQGEGYKVKEIALPKVEKNAFALKTRIRDNKLLVTVNKSDSLPFPDLYLLIHSRGLIVYANAWDSAKDYVTFEASVFPSGINHILLLTKDLQIVSERLVFLLSDDNGTATFQTQKDSYHKRELVTSEIQIRDEKQNPLVAGNFSIAVTNDKEVVTDTTTSILSGILLRSELRGTIENPEYYFQKGNKDAESAADLLMRTNGWTRYAIPDVIRGELSYPKIPFEQSQEISGTIKSGLFSKSAKKAGVLLVSPNSKFFDLTETDENGRYVFQNFEFPDSTKYVIQALNKNGKSKQMTELNIDKETFPGIHASLIESVIKEEKGNPVFMDYVAKADKQYLNEHGMRLINLPEVRVKGIYMDKYKYDLPFIPWVDYSYSAEDIERLHIRNAFSLIARIPGTMIHRPTVMVDNWPIVGIPHKIVGYGDIQYYNTINGYNYYKSINYNADIMRDQQLYSRLSAINVQNIKQVYAIGGANRSSLIAIYTKTSDEGIIPPANIKSVTPLGYQLPIEFYSPKYDTQESINNPNPDLRTTIYWKPNALTDKDGNAKLDFYTADDTGTYSVVIEGVSEDGKLIHYCGRAAITVVSDK